MLVCIRNHNYRILGMHSGIWIHKDTIFFNGTYHVIVLWQINWTRHMGSIVKKVT